MEEKLEQTKLTITTPKNCTRTHLSLNALDSHTHDLAAKTFITVEGKMLSCSAFKVLDNGDLQLTVRPEAFEIVQAQTV